MADNRRPGGAPINGEGTGPRADAASNGDAASSSSSSASTSSSSSRPRADVARRVNQQTNTDPNKGACYWCFTWNNPPDEYEQRIKDLYEDDANDIEYIVYGREIGESGTFHLQGFVQFGEPILNKELATNGPTHRLFQAHWTKARRVQKAREYCLKDGNWTEHGSFSVRQGKRTDIDEFKSAVEQGGMTTKKARKVYSEVCARYPRFVEAYINDHRTQPPIEEHAMYPWQRALFHKTTQTPPHPREVIFIVDPRGNTGKSWLARKIANQENTTAQYMTPGKLNDMAYALDETNDVLLMDCPRSRVELFQYDFIEYVKNCNVFSTKYESRMKYLKPAHVVVFMNETPDTGKLSRDRYCIIEVDEDLSRHYGPEPPPPPPQGEEEPPDPEPPLPDDTGGDATQPDAGATAALPPPATDRQRAAAAMQTWDDLLQYQREREQRQRARFPGMSLDPHFNPGPQYTRGWPAPNYN